MEQYIPKSALLAEMERRRDAALMRQQNLKAIGQESVINEMVANELNRIISFTDTLEVKEENSNDAFIEKACKWFRDIDYDDSIPPFETTEEFIEGFKKAMKL